MFHWPVPDITPTLSGFINIRSWLVTFLWVIKFFAKLELLSYPSLCNSLQSWYFAFTVMSQSDFLQSFSNHQLVFRLLRRSFMTPFTLYLGFFVFESISFGSCLLPSLAYSTTVVPFCSSQFLCLSLLISSSSTVVNHLPLD